MRRQFSWLLLAFVMVVVCAATIMAAAPKDGNVYLQGYLMDSKNVPTVPNELAKYGYAANEAGPYLIVFSGPIEEPMKDEAVQLGAKLVEYIPDFSFLALMTPEEAQQVAGLSCVSDVVIYQPAYKIHPSLLDETLQLTGNDEVVVNISLFGDDATVLDKELKYTSASKVKSGKGKITVKVNRGQLAKLAQLNTVKHIEMAPEYQWLNDVAKGIMEVDDLWLAGYNGAGQVVGIADTGLDTGVNNSTMHLDFQGRIDAIYALGRTNDASDPHGHGTHVSGSVLGDGARSGGLILGMAPAAHLVFQSVMDSSGGLGGLPTNLGTLFSQAKTAGARIHSNSWGAAASGAYTTDSQAVDQYLWDNHDMHILFAAGNSGSFYGLWTVYTSINAPGTAKNCITIGASENNRPSLGSYADNINQIAYFSSRGWTKDGRVKPDVVAPGTYILSTRSSLAPDDSFWANYNSYYAYMGGTSMATPLSAGAVAVARQYMQNAWGVTPTTALMKAAIINGAVDMGLGIPSRDQGWGRLNLVNSLRAKEYRYDNETTSLATNGTKTYTYTVASTGTPLRITLVWTDYPASPSASKALVNDLDLSVTAPNGTVYYGNDFTSPYNSAYDRTNNVENVFIGSPAVGTYTITVRGYNIPNGPQPFAIFASGDFQ